MINIAVAGSHGRMGKRIIALAEKDEGIDVVSMFDVGTDAEPQISKCDVIIEFTAPRATMEHVRIAGKLKKGMVIGTTGLSGEQAGIIKKAAENIPVVMAPNMSVGVNLLFKLCQDAARVLPGDYKLEITEAHHVHKKDAPSGTAKKLAELISAERKEAFSDIPIESIREGEIIGEHKVVFRSQTERIELFHSAKTRDTFAAGAIKAAGFLSGKKSGLYTMRDVLGIN
ncbi:MAG: 4-hydroxy-tetrahydrodipicolinate reductase [Candidatus Omnitrophota bacterium]|nr:4-hydroxy-tetrahydrodipicolinate reductase [Candidatus Omnitrophota bacterium]